jgi:photosynthetic reaction center H subunit
MGKGAITGYVDVAQIVLYMFWVFFAGLIYYLQRESKREGFPLENHLPGGRSYTSTGLISMPTPKIYKLANGSEVSAPSYKVSPQTLKATPLYKTNGAPLEPTGNPMLDGVGPGSYADRRDEPELNYEGRPVIVPLRVMQGFSVSEKDTNPIGMTVLGADGVAAGTVRDLWLDSSEQLFRFLEVSLPTASGQGSVLLPINFCRIGKDSVKVKAILGSQFALVPRNKQPDTVTLLEEEKIMAYYGGGTLYATPDRQEPLA